MWKKFVVGLRIIERVRDEYGEAGGACKEEFNPFTNRKKQKKTEQSGEDGAPDEKEDDMAGGFMANDSDTGSGFLPDGYDDDEAPHMNSGKDLEIKQEQAKESNGLHLLSAQDWKDDQTYNAPEPNDFPPPKPSRSSVKSTTPTSKSKNKSARKSSSKQELHGGTAPEEEQPISKGRSKVKRSSSKRESMPANTPKRRGPRRKAAQAVKSPYFEHGSDDNDEG